MPRSQTAPLPGHPVVDSNYEETPMATVGPTQAEKAAQQVAANFSSSEDDLFKAYSLSENDTTTNNTELATLAKKLGVNDADSKTYKLRAVQIVAEQRYQRASHMMTMFTGLLDKVDQMKQRIISKFAN